MTDESPAQGTRRVTLDGQLVTYWDREAARLDALAEQALFRWIARGYARRADRARALAERSRAREAARRRPAASEVVAQAAPELAAADPPSPPGEGR